MIMSKIDNLDNAARALMNALSCIDSAYKHIDKAFDGYDPGYPAPDSADARAWDYLDAIQIARNEIIDRLETWDGYER
jgi:hypothetical protein